MKVWLNRLWFTLVLWPFYWVRVYFVWGLRKRADRQLADVNRMIAARPDYAPFRLLRARVLAYLRQDLDTARDDLDHALRLNPRLAEQPTYYRRRSDVRLAVGDLDGALDELAASLKIDPKNREAYFRRAEILMVQGAYQEAILSLREGLKYDFGMEKKQLAAIRSLIAYALCELRQYRLAEAELAIAARYQRDYHGLARVRASLAVAQGDAGTLDRLLAEVPRKAMALKAFVLAQRGALRLYNDDPATALADFEQVVALTPGDMNAYLGRGSARFSGGDLAGARADFDEAIRREDRNGLARNNRGYLLLLMGEAEAAGEDIEAAVRLSPHAHPVWNTRGTWHLLRGEYAEALAAFERAEMLLNNDPRPSAAVIGQVAAHQALGEADTALALWRALGERHPDRGPLLAYVREKGYWPAAVMTLLEAVDARLGAG